MRWPAYESFAFNYIDINIVNVYNYKRSRRRVRMCCLLCWEIYIDFRGGFRGCFCGGGDK